MKLSLVFLIFLVSYATHAEIVSMSGSVPASRSLVPFEYDKTKGGSLGDLSCTVQFSESWTVAQCGADGSESTLVYLLDLSKNTMSQAVSEPSTFDLRTESTMSVKAWLAKKASQPDGQMVRLAGVIVNTSTCNDETNYLVAIVPPNFENSNPVVASCIALNVIEK